MELEFIELEFHKKCQYRYLKRHYRAPYGAIRLKKKTCMLKRHYKALKLHYKASYETIRLKKKTCMLKLHYRALKCHYRAP